MCAHNVPYIAQLVINHFTTCLFSSQCLKKHQTAGVSVIFDDVRTKRQHKYRCFRRPGRPKARYLRCFCTWHQKPRYLFTVFLRTTTIQKTLVEGSLEVKLPTIWTDGKAEMGRVREEKVRRKKIREEKESEERRCRLLLPHQRGAAPAANSGKKRHVAGVKNWHCFPHLAASQPPKHRLGCMPLWCVRNGNTPSICCCCCWWWWCSCCCTDRNLLSVILDALPLASAGVGGFLVHNPCFPLASASFLCLFLLLACFLFLLLLLASSCFFACFLLSQLPFFFFSFSLSFLAPLLRLAFFLCLLLSFVLFACSRRFLRVACSLLALVTSCLPSLACFVHVPGSQPLLSLPFCLLLLLACLPSCFCGLLSHACCSPFCFCFCFYASS